jgi:hypothetical protein
MNRKVKKYIIEKQNTETTTTDYNDDYDEYYSDTETTTAPTTTVPTTTTEQQGGRVYKSLQADYRKPINGSRQDNFTRDDILKRLRNYIPLKTIREKRILEKLPNFKTWIKYYNTTTRQFRTGGLLMKVSYPDYIMLINTSQNITWSVQLKDNIIYIPDQTTIEKTQRQLQQKEEDNKKEQVIKNKLYELYKRGKLAAKK